MAVSVDRIRKRVETDLLDPEITALIDDADKAIIARWGAHRDPAKPITAIVRGLRRNVDLPRPVDTAETVTVIERWDPPVELAVTLAANDYRVLHDGHTLERLRTGTNPPRFGRSAWAPRVEVVYVPVSDTAQRDEVVVKLVQLAVEYEGVERRQVGDHEQVSVNYAEEREQLLESLAPPRALLVS